jgi:hypothetical protein
LNKFRRENHDKCHFVSLSTGMFGFILFDDAVETFHLQNNSIQSWRFSKKKSAPEKIPNCLIASKWWSFFGIQSHWIVLIQWQPQNRHSLSY